MIYILFYYIVLLNVCLWKYVKRMNSTNTFKQSNNCYEMFQRSEKISSSQGSGFSDPRQSSQCETESHQNAVVETLLRLCEIQIIWGKIAVFAENPRIQDANISSSIQIKGIQKGKETEMYDIHHNISIVTNINIKGFLFFIFDV